MGVGSRGVALSELVEFDVSIIRETQTEANGEEIPSRE